MDMKARGDEEIRLRTLLAFYDYFLKLTLKGMREVLGDRGALGVLRFVARDYGAGLARSMRALGRRSLKEALSMVLERAGVEPGFSEEGGSLVVKLKRCPFRRPEEEPLLCAITQGLLEGFTNAFGKAKVSKLRTIAEGADSCAFAITFLET